MKHLDITFDFETVSTAPNAAPMQLAAIVWDRNATGDHPFMEGTFCAGIDLRTCAVEGFAFDQDTIDWWSRQNDTAKQNVTEDECYAVDTAFQQFAEWIEQMKQKYEAETVCLWCQGQDFDFPILKTIARKFGLKMPVHQHYFRDCRTYVLEAALMLAQRRTAEHGGDEGTSGRTAEHGGDEGTSGRTAEHGGDEGTSGRTAEHGGGEGISGRVAEHGGDEGTGGRTAENGSGEGISGRTAGHPGVALTVEDIMRKPMRAYDMIPNIGGEWLEGRTQHDALYDCLRSSWSVWQCMKMLRQ